MRFIPKWFRGWTVFVGPNGYYAVRGNESWNVWFFSGFGLEITKRVNVGRDENDHPIYRLVYRRTALTRLVRLKYLAIRVYRGT